MSRSGQLRQATAFASLLVFLTGCGAPAPSPDLSQTVPAAESPTPSPTPAHLAARLGIEAVCLEIEQSYPQLDAEFSEPIDDTFGRVLRAMGVLVVAPGDACDATLRIDVTCEARGASYDGAPADPCYTGASCGGEMILSLPEGEPDTWSIRGEEPVAQGIIFHCPSTKEKAPFESAWTEAVAVGLERVWGPKVLVHTLGKVIEFDTGAPVMTRAAAAMDDRLQGIGPEAVPDLAEALRDPDWRVRWAAASALEYLGPEAADAVPALADALGDSHVEVRERVARTLALIGPEAVDAVPALMEALEDEEHNVRALSSVALVKITGKDFETEIATPTPTAIPTVAVGQPQLVTTIRSGGDPVQRISFSPDGTLLAIAYEDSVRVWRVDGTEQILTIEENTEGSHSVAFAPEGSLLATGGREGIHLWDPATGGRVRSLEPVDRVDCLAFSPDGRTLASGGGSLDLWDVASGQRLRTLSASSDSVLGVAFSPDGKTLASSGYDETARLWDVETGEMVFRLWHGDTVYAVAYSPDGATLATAVRLTVRLWDVGTGEELEGLPKLGGWTADVAYSPDGRVLASAASNGSVSLLDVRARRELVSIDAHEDRTTCVAFAPDGRSVASGSEDGTVKLWDIAGDR